MKITLDAYAKINLYLDIIRKRENGYHDIKGVMQKISLSDKVTVEAEKAEEVKIELSCSSPSIPTGSDNIAYRAAELYLKEYSSEPYKVKIHIEKNIPAAGGLAGGSTDAAAVLRALDTLINDKKNISDLITRSAVLGADVPFCLSEGGMITEGIGDILTPCPALSDCAVLVVNTKESVSTPAAYRKLDELHDDFKVSSFDRVRFEKMMAGLYEKDAVAVCEGMFNIFEEAVLCDCPLSKKAKNVMLEKGAVGAMMSGSGSTIFGIYNSEQEAESAYEVFTSLGYTTKITKIV